MNPNIMKKNSFFAVSSAIVVIALLNISSAYATEGIGSDHRTGVMAKAMKDFKKQFKTVNDETWVAIPDGYLSSFYRDGVTNRIYYNKAGSWQFTVREAGEKLLSGSLKADLKSVYFDYGITCVHEIRSSGNIIYVVTVEDKKTVRKVKISGDREFEVIQDLVKE
jgi:hypothetical protein